jgi:hypothetical protein
VPRSSTRFVVQHLKMDRKTLILKEKKKKEGSTKKKAAKGGKVPPCSAPPLLEETRKSEGHHQPYLFLCCSCACTGGIHDTNVPSHSSRLCGVCSTDTTSMLVVSPDATKSTPHGRKSPLFTPLLCSPPLLTCINTNTNTSVYHNPSTTTLRLQCTFSVRNRHAAEV